MTPVSGADAVLPSARKGSNASNGSERGRNSHTYETRWDKPCSASTSMIDPSPLMGTADAVSQEIAKIAARADAWLTAYTTAGSVSERVNVFFTGLEVLRSAADAHNAARHKAQQESAALLLKSIDTALASLSEILEVASSTTRSYSRLSGYKEQLERYRRVAGGAGERFHAQAYSAAMSDQIRDICEEVATISKNLQPLSQPGDAGAAANVSSLCDAYGVYVKRKKQRTTRERWALFAESRAKRNADQRGSSPGDTSPAADTT
ncbi:molecular chaperone, putative [Babesia ovata]|uniref:Molecular chaperone, putative n=1 Tax=Babesia ovata TaxID=189622 RepID=A0A2H6KDC7_9APIC|nr:molecular chaperone, putative [Babesia ovata]GBE60995.1 molecular chaperone, putative [Babesia ovata]